MARRRVQRTVRGDWGHTLQISEWDGSRIRVLARSHMGIYVIVWLTPRAMATFADAAHIAAKRSADRVSARRAKKGRRRG